MTEAISQIFTNENLNMLFPADRADDFFDALFGDASEGAYNIGLVYKSHTQNELSLEFHLTQRPGKCLACNLTYGLPQVFSRHPIINIKGLLNQIDKFLVDFKIKCSTWKLGSTKEISRQLHIVPLIISMEPA
ncbi:pancreas/duodenum homeobox protein 1 [Desulfobacterales bacterium HSG17]|nr:pancreas/duodenum homeobox protein 1 [Desulfobacterales bacterium HSG17]